MDTKEIKENLKNNLSKVKTFIYGSEPGLFGVPVINLTDYEIRNGELKMVLFSIKFETQSDEDLYGFLDMLKHITKTISKLMYKIAFDKEGKMVKPSNDNVIFSGGVLLSGINFSIRDSVLSMEVDCMFHGDY